MRTCLLLVAVALLPAIGCRKTPPVIIPAGPPDTCAWKTLTGVKTDRQDTGAIRYNRDGRVDFGYGTTYFNGGTLIVSIGAKDTVVYDSIGRVKYMKLPFDFEGRRQTRWYFYDSLNRIEKTLTHTGNGIDYWAGLIYDERDDIIEMYYGINTPITSYRRFRFSYYDTPCVDQYLGLQDWGQIGITRGRHLMKTSADFSDSKYTYVLDSNKRVLVSYRDYDNSGWYTERAVDTTLYFYSCR